MLQFSTVSLEHWMERYIWNWMRISNQRRCHLRRIPLAVQDRLNEELKRLEDLGIIELVTEATDWVSALVVTEKKTSKAIRICLDPAALNKALKRCDYSLPTMEDVLPRLSRAKVFTVCDVHHGYWHIQLGKTSSLLTTFPTLRCHQQFWLYPVFLQ